MAKLIIASDFDGTIIDHTKIKISLAQMYGFKLTARETSSKIMKGLVPYDIYREIQRKIYGEETKNSVPVIGAIDVLKSIKEYYGQIYIISRRVQEKEISSALKWIERNLAPTVEQSKVFFVKCDEDKDIIAKKLGVNVYIDDRPETLDAMPSVQYRFLFDSHNNFQKSEYPSIKTWAEFSSHLAKIKA